MNTSAIFDDPILDDKIPVFQPKHQILLLKAYKKSNIPPKPKVVDKALESFKNLIKKLYNKRDTSFQLKESKSALKKFAVQCLIDGKHWIDFDLFQVNAKQSKTNKLINTRETKAN